MSATLQLSQAAVSPQAHHCAAKVPADADRAKDLFALWRAVFDGAQGFNDPRDDTHASAVEVWVPLQLRELSIAPNTGKDGVALNDACVSQSSDAAALQPVVPAHAAGAEPVNAESINVFVQSAAVSIVVRDATLPEHEALRCAFETARQLVGHSGALRQLTLNGRTLYQQSLSSTPCLPPPVLVFAC